MLLLEDKSMPMYEKTDVRKSTAARQCRRRTEAITDENGTMEQIKRQKNNKMRVNEISRLKSSNTQLRLIGM
jgi:hypothetical protein